MKILLYNIGRHLIIIILVIATYWPTFSGDFILDDHALIKNNRFIQESQPLFKYFIQEDGVASEKDLGIYHTGYYRPLINLTYRVDYLVWGMDAQGFRITNVFLHIMCCFLLLFFFAIFLEKNVALFTTILFSLHPVNTEAVSFIVSRNNVIVAIFFLGALTAYIKAWEKDNLYLYIFSILFFTGAIFSKEFGLMLIPLFFLYQRLLTNKKNNSIKEIISYIPFLLVAATYLILRKIVTDSSLTQLHQENLWSRIFYVPVLIYDNIKIIFLPYNLHILYKDFPTSSFSWPNIIYVLSFIFLILIIWKVRKKRMMIFSILAFFICLFPVLNIIPTSSVSLISMRWLYLPMIFLFMGLGIFINKALLWKRDLTKSILIVIIFYMGGYTYILNKGLWHDDDTLIKQEVLGFDNVLFYSEIANKYLNNKDYYEADKYFKIAIEEFPFQASNYINYSALMIETGRPDNAINILKKAKSLVMTYHEQGQWYNNMGMALWVEGDMEAALEQLNKAVIRAPEEEIFWANIGAAYGMKGEYKKSINVLKKGASFLPNSLQLKISLAKGYINLREYQKAILLLEEIPENERKGNMDILRLLEKARNGINEKNID
jgi:tetratricopeptide (TPR) repeat protein